MQSRPGQTTSSRSGCGPRQRPWQLSTPQTGLLQLMRKRWMGQGSLQVCLPANPKTPAAALLILLWTCALPGPRTMGLGMSVSSNLLRFKEGLLPARFPQAAIRHPTSTWLLLTMHPLLCKSSPLPSKGQLMSTTTAKRTSPAMHGRSMVPERIKAGATSRHGIRGHTAGQVMQIQIMDMVPHTPSAHPLSCHGAVILMTHQPAMDALRMSLTKV